MWEKVKPHIVVHYYFGASMNQFMLESDSYAHWVILAPEEGAFRYSILEKEEEAVFGQVVLCPPGTTLWREVSTPALSFHFVEFQWPDLESLQPDKTGNVPFGAVSIADKVRLLSTFDYLKRSSSDKDLSSHYVFDLLLLCLDSMRAEEKALQPIDALISKIAAHIEEHAATAIKLEDIAAEFGLTSSQLTRRFQAAYRKGPAQYLTSVRIHNIKELLMHTDHTIDTIAQLTGFQNGFYMSRVFTQQTKMNPSEFRKTHRI